MTITSSKPSTNPTRATTSSQASTETKPAAQTQATSTEPTKADAEVKKAPVSAETSEGARLRAQNNLRASLLQTQINDLSLPQKPNPEIAKMASAASAKFETRANQILHRDASSLAMGKTPSDPSALSTDQQSKLKDATTDYISDLPIGALSDGLKAGLSKFGIDTSKHETTKLGDLGDVGAEAAKNLAQDFQQRSPKLFYGTAGVAAAGALAFGYKKGSQGLEDLGVKPEFSFDLGKTEVDVAPTWAPGFKDIGGSIHARRDFGAHTFGLGTEYSKGDFNPTLSYGFDGKHLDVDAFATLGKDPSGNFSATYKKDDLSMYARGAFGADVVDKLSVGANYNFSDKSRLGLNASHDFDSDAFNAALSFGYQPTKDIDLQLRGGVSEERGGFIGLGLTARF